jgi:molecular chaperone DnaK
MLATHAVGIDLGTTYSCIAYLNEHGEPVTIPNRDGELNTPSVVMFDGGQVIVGTEALRNSVRAPERVVMHAKRYMGDLDHVWTIQGRAYSPIDISTYILQSLLHDARQRIGDVDRAVITVPAQFSDVQRQATAEAGRRAGLKHVDIINEPVAAALCFVLGSEGIWFTELATSQVIMVVDLGGGTFDLSLVRYEKNAVRVIASGGDLHLGGLDWNNTLQKAILRQFQKEFGVDPAGDRESLQALALEVEQTKRSLSVRPKAALTCQHLGRRKTYQAEVEQFERLTKPHVDRMRDLT